MTGWRLEHPWLAAGAVLLLVLVLLLRRQRDERIAGVGHHGVATIDVPWLATITGVLLAIVALANPQYGVQNSEQTNYGVAILSVVDTSGSMAALDFGEKKASLSRMEGAKRVLNEFIAARVQDLHGIVVFGEVVFTLVPLTADQDLLQQSIRQIDTDIAGQSTAIGDALALGAKRLRDAPVESRVVILISDGENTAGNLQPLEAAKFAAEEGVKVYTIGIGTGGMAPVEVSTLFGKRLRQVQIPIDEETLKAIAEMTGGRYFNATNIEEMKTVFSEIDQLEKSDFESNVSVQYRNHYPVYLRWSIALLICSALWQLAIRPRFPWV